MYNSLSALPKGLYNILNYLALSPEAEDIWKMLKYNSYDALSKPNLTIDEKIALLWREGKQEPYSVFFTPLIEDSITESKCILQMYNYYIHPSNLFYGVVVYSFDFLYGGKMSLVEYEGVPVSRGDLFINKLLSVLNGADIGGVGKLMFFDDLSRYSASKFTLGNNKTFTGYQVLLATNMGDSGVQSGCEN